MRNLNLLNDWVGQTLECVPEQSVIGPLHEDLVVVNYLLEIVLVYITRKTPMVC